MYRKQKAKKHFTENSDYPPVFRKVIMRAGITNSYNRHTISIYRVDAGTRVAKALSATINGGIIYLQICRPEVPLQVAMSHAIGMLWEMAKVP